MKFVARHGDRWRSVGGDDGPMVTITPGPDRLLTLGQWHSVRNSWPAGLEVGVALPNDAPVEDLAADLGGDAPIALIALDFPKWTDGRAYSQARLLRARWRYAGEIRATGEVLVDMLPLLRRTGFDAVLLRADQSIDAAERALAFFHGHYQADVHEHRPLFALPQGEADALARKRAEFVGDGASI
ncbi:MAG TPA: DUF934 domain-containing protein [Methylibium sp.]|uniref:DUF934 domain-containing protein n=1 Tax=Methylibium sp. TaxID=2067992 RepID=UPI002DB8A5EB|nr:DUF934 domain-containing protein [Methylibium sp.]HEU4460004.1 DUF934 domain-containing protein [Methylibium sp.]